MDPPGTLRRKGSRIEGRSFDVSNALDPPSAPPLSSSRPAKLPNGLRGKIKWLVSPPVDDPLEKKMPNRARRKSPTLFSSTDA